MKMKKQLTLFCTALLTIGSLCGCGSSETSGDAAQQNTSINEEMSKPGNLAEITAIDGTTVTLQLLGGRGVHGMGKQPQMPDGTEKPEMDDVREKSEMKNDQQPSDTGNKERPEMPEGAAPPEMNDEQQAPGNIPPVSDPITLDLSAFDTVDVSALTVGDYLSLTMDEERNITAVEKTDRPEMPVYKSPVSEEETAE